MTTGLEWSPVVSFTNQTSMSLFILLSNSSISYPVQIMDLTLTVDYHLLVESYKTMGFSQSLVNSE